jgi:hypothetical protein
MNEREKSQNNPNMEESGIVNSTGAFKLCNVIITLDVTNWFHASRNALNGCPVSKHLIHYWFFREMAY